MRLLTAVAAAIGVLWLLATETGTEWVMERLTARTSPALTVGRVSGTMLGGLVIEDVRLRLTRDQLDIGRLEARWNPAAALLGELAFSTARSSTVSYRRLPSTGAAPGGPIPALPFTLRIDDAVAEGVRVEIGNDVPPFHADAASGVVPLALKLAQQNKTYAVCYATEASLFQAGGAPAVVCGPGDIAQAHAPDEYIEVAELEKCLAFLDRVADWAKAS